MQGNRLSTNLEMKQENPDMKELYLKLQQYCRFLTQDKYDGEDAAQEVMLKAYLTYDQSALSSALLNRMAYHHWIDVVRKRKRETPCEPPERGGADHANQMIERRSLLEHLLSKCTPKQAVLFLLKEVFHYQANELAELLGTTETSVKSAVFRAKKRLSNEKGEADSYWDEVEREWLSDLMYTSLQFQDPAPLLKALPDILTFESTDSPALVYIPFRQLSSASLKMAA
ncbi:sigma factor-like helix-turn-helix DNA-binding protein [Metabacillus indicus]|uniref:sigma factor-like helix-turn-helix DNA-binding protein n=1 Tax=Metabacillus indicus TaxID=246786 RepID=UPI00068A981F|nr:sigma factor-like helix-turn-helix DNA-binding protein [Metabacillus indicus]